MKLLKDLIGGVIFALASVLFLALTCLLHDMHL